MGYWIIWFVFIEELSPLGFIFKSHSPVLCWTYSVRTPACAHNYTIDSANCRPEMGSYTCTYVIGLTCSYSYYCSSDIRSSEYVHVYVCVQISSPNCTYVHHQNSCETLLFQYVIAWVITVCNMQQAMSPIERCVRTYPVFRVSCMEKLHSLKLWDVCVCVRKAQSIEMPSEHCLFCLLSTTERPKVCVWHCTWGFWYTCDVVRTWLTPWLSALQWNYSRPSTSQTCPHVWREIYVCTVTVRMTKHICTHVGQSYPVSSVLSWGDFSDSCVTCGSLPSIWTSFVIQSLCLCKPLCWALESFVRIVCLSTWIGVSWLDRSTFNKRDSCCYQNTAVKATVWLDRLCQWWLVCGTVVSKTIEWTVTFHESWKVGERKQMMTCVQCSSLTLCFLPPSFCPFSLSALLSCSLSQALICSMHCTYKHTCTYVRMYVHVHALARTYPTHSLLPPNSFSLRDIVALLPPICVHITCCGWALWMAALTWVCSVWGHLNGGCRQFSTAQPLLCCCWYEWQEAATYYYNA